MELGNKCLINNELHYVIFDSCSAINGQLCNDVVEEWVSYIDDFYDDLFEVACDEYSNKFHNEYRDFLDNSLLESDCSCVEGYNLELYSTVPIVSFGVGQVGSMCTYKCSVCGRFYDFEELFD